jgi:6-phosphogluconolactonase
VSSKTDPADCLTDIVGNIERIESYVVGMSRHNFANDARTQDAVERCLEGVCEAVSRLGGMTAAMLPSHPFSRHRRNGQPVAARLRQDRSRIDLGHDRDRPPEAEGGRGARSQASEPGAKMKVDDGGKMRRQGLARRRVLTLGIGAISSIAAQTLIGGPKAMAESSPETVVYVSNAGSKEIFVLAMNRATGALALIEKTVVPGSDKPSPASLPMATSPDRHFLYAQLRSAPYPVSTFAIDPRTGRLEHLALTPLVDQMAYLHTDRTGRFLLAASYVGAKLAIYPIDARGVVEAKATQILDTKPKAHCVVIDAANADVYVPVLGGDIVMELRFDPATGTVSPNGPGEVATKPGAGPRHLTFHPNGKFAYLITETTATIGAYAVEPGGTLRELQFVDTNDYRQQPAASDIHVTPDGRFLYGAERKTSMLIGFRIDPNNGTLSVIGRFPTEQTPRGFAIEPRGRFLLSVGMDSDAMTVYAIDPTSGELKPVGHYPMGRQPNWIEIVDLK